MAVDSFVGIVAVGVVGIAVVGVVASVTGVGIATVAAMDGGYIN